MSYDFVQYLNGFNNSYEEGDSSLDNNFDKENRRQRREMAQAKRNKNRHRRDRYNDDDDYESDFEY